MMERVEIFSIQDYNHSSRELQRGINEWLATRRSGVEITRVVQSESSIANELTVKSEHSLTISIFYKVAGK